MSSTVEEEWFTVIWKIENFSACLFEDNISLSTSIFETKTDDGSVWWKLKVENENLPSPSPSLVFKLERLNGFSENDKCQMSLSCIFGEIKLVEKSKVSNDVNFYFIAQKAELFGQKEDRIIPQVPANTITFYCKISHVKIKSRELSLCTILQKQITQWDSSEVNWNGSKSSIVQCANDVQLILTVINFSSHNYEAKCRVYFELFSEDVWPVFVNSKLSAYENVVTNSIGNILCNVKFWDITLRASKSGWIYPSLKLDFVIANTVHLFSKPTVKEHERATGSSSSLSDDFLHMYTQNMFSDVIINTVGKSFSAHRSVLCARSPIFRTMFEKDCRTVDIDDLDSVTVERFLVFLYSDSLVQLEWEETCALYNAANKFAVVPLKQRCVDILKEGLSTSNVFKALALADKHNDEQLMRCVLDFVDEHVEILSSKEYDEFAEKEPQLAAKAVRNLYLNIKISISEKM